METTRLYLGKLGEFKKVLTQQGDLDKALEVSEEEKRIFQLIDT